MKKKSTSKSAFFNLRVLTGLFVGLAIVSLMLVAFSALSKAFAQGKQREEANPGEHEDPAARMAWERLRLQDQHGRISPGGLLRAYQYKKTMPYRPEAWAEFTPKNSLAQPEAVQSIWTSIGPGNIGGRTRSIIIHPSNANTIWLGAVGGGVWKTTDGGNSWSTTTDFLANLAVDCMAIDPTNSNVLYAGTGERFPFDGIRGNGIFKTANGGTTWTQLASTANNPDFYDVTRVAVAAYPPTRGTILLVATTTGLFRSTDTFHWSQVKAGMGNTVVFQPNNGANCLASFGFYTDFGGVFYSTDYGLTWAPSTINSNKPITGRVELAYAPSNPNIVYASADDYAYPAVSSGELLKSTDGGHSFATTHVLNTLDTIGWYANTLWVAPNNPDVVVVGGYNLYRSTDGGNTPARLISGDGHPDSHVDHHVVINDPNYDGSANQKVYVGSDGGIRRTDTILGSASWTSLNHTLGITQFYGATANSAGSTIIGGTQDNGTLRYQGNPEAWDSMFGGDGGFCAWTGSYFYGEYPVLRLFRSSDGSSQNLEWPVSSPPETVGNWAAPIVVDPNNLNRLLAGGTKLWRSNNPNTSNPLDVAWTSIKSPQQGDDNISAIAVAPGFPDIIWVGHDSGRIYMTTNGTTTNPSWIRVDRAPLPQRYIESIAFAGWRPGLYNNVYVTFGGNDYDDGFSPDNVWRTTNSGGTWTNISSGLPSVPIRSIVTSQSSSNPGYLYVGSAVGVFASADNGVTWSPGIAGDVPANVFVDQLFWANGPSRLVVVTHGRGMFTANAQ